MTWITQVSRRMPDTLYNTGPHWPQGETEMFRTDRTPAMVTLALLVALVLTVVVR